MALQQLSPLLHGLRLRQQRGVVAGQVGQQTGSKFKGVVQCEAVYFFQGAGVLLARGGQALCLQKGFCWRTPQ